MHRFRERLENLETEFKERRQEQSETKEVEAVVSRIHKFAKSVEKGLRDADWSKRREIIRALVKQVEVDNKQVRVVYKVTPRPFVQAPKGAVCKIV